MALVAILLLALGFRLYDIQNKSLWFDTAHSLALADRSNLVKVLQGAVRDMQSPLYFLLLRFWMQLNDTEVWARLLSVAFGVGNVYMT
ncbi:MAG: hypothetical protein HY664_06355, partial [Chloroflexi bacterium]|nr:hypothetical protein [Chloroflexota bacterium]